MCGRGLRTAVLACVCGSFNFGYTTGAIAGALVYIKEDLRMSGIEKGALVSSVLVGAFLGAAFSSRSAEWLGRRRAQLVNNVWFLLGGAGMAVAPGLWTLAAARMMAGIGVGVCSSLCNLYISEISPPEQRGSYAAAAPLTVTLGILVSYLASYGLSFVSHGWRVGLALTAAPAILQLLLSLCAMPESPRWLIRKGRRVEAAIALRQLRGRYVPPSGLDAELDSYERRHRRPGGHPDASHKQGAVIVTFVSPALSPTSQQATGHGSEQAGGRSATPEPALAVDIREPLPAPSPSPPLPLLGSECSSPAASPGCAPSPEIPVPFASGPPLVAVLPVLGHASPERPAGYAALPAVTYPSTGRSATALQASAHVAPEGECGSTEPRPASVCAILCSRRMRFPLATGVGLNVLQQVCGINVVIYYAPTILSNAGFHDTEAVLLTAGIATFQLMATYALMRIVDRLGRRPLTFVGLGGMIAGLVALGVTFLPALEDVRGLRWLAVAGMLLYRVSFSFSLGPMPFIVTAEVFPARHASLGVAVAWACNWLSNFAVSLTFLPLLHGLTPTGAFGAYLGMCIVAVLFSCYVVPETRGRSLDEEGLGEQEEPELENDRAGLQGESPHAVKGPKVEGEAPAHSAAGLSP